MISVPAALDAPPMLEVAPRLAEPPLKGVES